MRRPTKRASLYEAAIGALSWYQRPARAPVVSRWLAALAIISLIALAVILIWMARPSGLIAAVVVTVAMVGLFVGWFAMWNVVLTRVHLALLDRPHLDESQRVAWFTAALLGYPILSVAVVVLVYGVARSLASG
jgi:hypothetical protein